MVKIVVADQTAEWLAAELPVSRQAVSKHLAALNEAGLVESRREGRETRYELTPAPMACHAPSQRAILSTGWPPA